MSEFMVRSTPALRKKKNRHLIIMDKLALSLAKESSYQWRNQTFR